MVVARLAFQLVVAIFAVDPVVARAAGDGLAREEAGARIDFIQETVVASTGIDDVVA